ncbi:MAG: redoxin family protein [Capsulimonadales bacterium]|nr:redoxin family protein [Capsulimonadales bacterium]
MKQFPNAGRFLAVLGLLPVLLLTVAAKDSHSGSDIRRRGRSVNADLPVTPATKDRSYRFRDIQGSRATVLIFVGTNCPIARRYRPEVLALRQQYARRGVSVALVYPNAGENRRDIVDFAGEALKSVPALSDPKQTLADAVGATMTPEAAVLDATGTVRYCGRIDDWFTDLGKPRTNGATSRDLRSALNAVLSGKAVARPTVAAVGCLIERTDRTSVATGPTYAEHIAPILNKNCVSCHRSGEIGPMPLAKYGDAVKYAANIAAVTSEKRMPPWKPIAGHGEFADERRLSDAEVALIKLWADAGAPEGDRRKTPPTPTFPEGWRLGKPDLILRMPTAWKVDANSPDTYRCFVLPTGLTEDKEVVGIEYRAGNKGVVHHILSYIDTAGVGRDRDAKEDGPGYTSFGGPGFMPFGELGGWAPGNLPRFLPNGIGRKLPAGSDVVMQVHYHASGKPEEDVTEVGLYFAKKPVTRPFRIIPVAVRKLEIPAGEANHTVTQTYPVPVDAVIHQVTPHMHLLGRKIEMTATLPDGRTLPLIRIDDWDFKWQDSYYFKEPVRLPKGSKVTLTASFDNSTGNPRNPNTPPQRVTWGEATTDEMCIGFLGFTAVDENDPLVQLYDRLLQRRGERNPEGDRRLREAARELLGQKPATP